jgi:hypothetical protein
MDKTLFTSPMVETFKVCRRAYHFAFGQTTNKVDTPKSEGVCKRFLLRALAEIDRGRLTNVNQVQKFMGINWPVDKLKGDDAVKAFLFSYKALTNYVLKPYRPKGAQVVGVALKVRARIPHARVYLEDNFDTILWYPAERKLEFVDYHLHSLKPFNEAWPAPSILVKQFLAERLRVRWPYEKLQLTFCKIAPQGFTQTSYTLDESLYKLHWPDLLKTIDDMKDPTDYQPHKGDHCTRCQFLQQCIAMPEVEESHHVYRTA